MQHAAVLAPVLCLLAAPAVADTRYKIQPSHGAIVATYAPCGEKTRDELAALIAKIPILVIQTDGWALQTQDLSRPANDVVDHVGWWWFPKEEPKNVLHRKELVLSLRPYQGEWRPLRVSIIERRDDGSDCSESWEGKVSSGK